MQDASVPDVLIVGAGPVGLTMAAACSHHGLKCRIIDKAPQPSDKSKALVVWSRTLELLDKLGLADTFIQHGIKATGASIYDQKERLVHITIGGVDSPFNFPLMIPQNETERLLTEHLQANGLTIERQVELSSFAEQAESISGVLRHADGREEPFETPWLLGCDGAHSTVRHTLAIPFDGDAEPSDWILADAHLAGPLVENEISIYWHKAGLLAIFPIIHNRFRVIADLGPATTSTLPRDPTLAEVQATIDQRGPAGLKLSDPIWLSRFRINERKVAEYRHGRAFLAGDAAHIHSPAGGQGMNTGMQDAFNLAWKLAFVQRGAAQAGPLLDSFSLERSAVGEQVLRGAGMMTLVATLRNPVAQFCRNRAASVLTSFGFVQDKIKNSLCELSINYRHSPLSMQDGPRHHSDLLPGDRMPDARLTDRASNSATTLFAVLRGKRFTLLLLPESDDPRATSELLRFADGAQRDFPDVLTPYVICKAGATIEAPAKSPPQLTDEDDRIHRVLGVTSPAAVVIRPDGYIGYRCQPADAAKLRNYLERFLTTGRRA